MVINQPVVFKHVIIDGTGPKISINRKFSLNRQVSQANMAASSGLRENIYSLIFLCQNVVLYIIIILL